MKDFWENRSYSDSAENEAEGIKNEKDSENIAEEESFIRNWFKELKMDLKKVLVIIIALIFFAGYRVARREIAPVALDLIFEKHLEKYNDSLEGQDDIVNAIVSQTKHEKQLDSLDYYNLKIKNSLYDLFDK